MIIGRRVDVGDEGCQCRDESAVLASLYKRSCQTSEGQNGVLLTVEGPCVPYSYGSNCFQHDLINDPKCKMMTTSSPDHCLRSWCYVDSSSCMLSSSQRLYRSIYFPHNDGVDLFYSYTKCDSSLDDWSTIPRKQTLGGLTITATSPTAYAVPYIFKRSPSGDILAEAGNEYYNNSVPFEGVLVNYLNSLQDLADGDFKITWMYGSKASNMIHPTSSFTAVVQDIEDGLLDMGVSTFWVTGERLKMAAFTKMLTLSPQLLVIPEPRINDSLIAQTSKVLEPFTMGAWCLILAMIIFAAFLSVWFSDRSKLAKKNARELRHKQSNRRVKSVYARLAVDQFLEKGIFFCSAGVNQDGGASLPNKVMFHVNE
mmetsp:Transcript_4400/g.9924  ORF Transcript_4400/g.9924 Transcript_4400/m.9924 type:complete len:369 (+) Transcript_4400:242-1348(+)